MLFNTFHISAFNISFSLSCIVSNDLLNDHDLYLYYFLVTGAQPLLKFCHPSFQIKVRITSSAASAITYSLIEAMIGTKFPKVEATIETKFPIVESHHMVK
jgi:hypothetical protein